MASQPSGEVFFALCKSVDSPIALGAWLRYKYDQRQLAEMRIHPRNYLSAASFHADYCVVSFLRKYEGLNTGINKREVALEAFATFERKCYETNNRFRDPMLRGIPPRVHSVLHRMQRKIASVLGPLKVSKVLSRCRWGNGATASLSRRVATVDNKISEAPLSVTSSALPYMRSVLESDPHWFETICGHFPGGPYSVSNSVFRVLPGDVIDTVPKDATTDRCIGKTPTANSFLQQGVGLFIRSRLKRVGIDLDNQEVNQVWASLAQTLDLATLDLQGASDTLSQGVVSHLLPLDWYLFLDSLRSPFIRNGEEWIRQNKFSAMGTAFTFELESLIFWAAVESSTEISDPRGIVSIYGDDIICSQRSAPLVIEVLETLGFTVNVAKSYTSGRFFESCGKHYFDGVDVTPVFQKENLDVGSLSSESAIRCGNRLYRLLQRCTRDNHGYVARAADNSREAIWRIAPGRSHQFLIPDACTGDEGWLTPFHELPWPFDENHGFFCRVLLPSSNRCYGKQMALFAHALRITSGNGSSPSESGNELSLITRRSAQPAYKPGWMWVAPHVVL